jgi:hypothetical protein
MPDSTPDWTERFILPEVESAAGRWRVARRGEGRWSGVERNAAAASRRRAGRERVAESSRPFADKKMD